MGLAYLTHAALDQIISEIMENSNAHRPVAATDEVVDKLPREVLEEGCECASYPVVYKHLRGRVSSTSGERMCCLQGTVQGRNRRS